MIGVGEKAGERRHPFIPFREAWVIGTVERNGGTFYLLGVEVGWGENFVQINMANKMSLQTKGNGGI